MTLKQRVQTLSDLGIAAPLPEPANDGDRRKKVREGLGDRGKYAEKETEKVLKAWNNIASFAYERLPDARAARGAMKAQVSDFMCWYRREFMGLLVENLCIPLEVKSTEHKTKRGSYLLSASSLEQLPRLKKAALAGATPFVLVYFKATDRWRIAHIDFFKFGETSWDMSNLPEFPTPKAALESTGFFPTGR